MQRSSAVDGACSKTSFSFSSSNFHSIISRLAIAYFIFQAYGYFFPPFFSFVSFMDGTSFSSLDNHAHTHYIYT